MPADELAGLLTRLADWSPRIDGEGEPEPEFTIEINPDDVNNDSANTWVDAHVNRVSLGLQSFEPAVLEWMHRTHGVDDAERAVGLLRDAGVRSLSMDLIFGLPSELGRDWLEDLRRALELEPDHLSVYGLTVEPRTPLARWIGRGAATSPTEDTFERQFIEAHEVLAGAGFEHYEVSNYAKPGHRSRHNQAYWSGQKYLGLGPSAHGYDGEWRYWNVAPWAAYETAIREGRDPTVSLEQLSTEQKQLEATYLGLRTADGISAGLIESWPESLRNASLEQGWLVLEGDRARLTPLGWLRLDAIVAGA
jgi:oxygen-independent coproporphyrinogen-3 oxidase